MQEPSSPAPLTLARNGSIKKTNNFASPNKDRDIEEYQKRRIHMEDFLQGTPNWKKLGSKAFRKFNRELLKSTC